MPKPSFSSPPDKCQAQTLLLVIEQKCADPFAISFPQQQQPVTGTEVVGCRTEYFAGTKSPTRHEAVLFLVLFDVTEVGTSDDETFGDLTYSFGNASAYVFVAA